ncbi:MAG: hypothetical protein ACKO5K_00930 [Armatimonadota bacterium]
MCDPTATDWEGYAFTFCKAGFLVLIFTSRYALLAISGLAAACYLIATLKGNTRWRCWLRPPWVTGFWMLVLAEEVARHLGWLDRTTRGIATSALP